MSSVSLLQLDPLSGAVINSCSLPEMPGHPRYGHSMNGDLACGGSPGTVMTLRSVKDCEDPFQVTSKSLVNASVCPGEPL